MDSGGSKGSGSDDEPLVPDDFDDQFYKSLLEKIPEITKTLRQKDTQDNADNVQRVVICANRYKSDLRVERSRAQNLSEEIISLEDRLENLTKMNQLDQDTIAELRTVIESAWKQKDAAQMREQVVQDELLKLREKADELEESVRQMNDKRSALQAKRADLKEREALKAEIKDLNKRLQIQRLYTNEVEKMTQTLDEKNKALLKVLEETSAEAYTHKKRFDVLQKEHNAVKAEEVKKSDTIMQIRGQNEHLTKVKVRQNLQILSLKTNMEHLNTQHNAACNKLAKTIVELEYTIRERDRLRRELVQRCSLLNQREDELIKLKQDNGKLAKSQESTARKYASLDEAKRVAEEEQIRLKTQLGTQDKELEAMRRVVHQFEKNNEHLIKERDILKRDLLLEHKTAEENDGYFQESQHEIKSLKDTVHQMDVRYKKLKDDFAKLKHEKAKKLDEIQTLLDKMDTLQNDIHLKDNYEIELKRTISDLEMKIVKIQAHQKTLENEKIALLRNIQVGEEERDRLRTQLTNLENAMELLRGKISYRDGEISKLQLQQDRMEKERRLLKAELHHTKLAHQLTRNDLTKKKKDIVRYIKNVAADDLQMIQMRKKYDKMCHEKNAVSVLLTSRNNEIVILKDELLNLRNLYEQTEKKFLERSDDVKLLRTEVNNLRSERDVLRKDRESSADLRVELLQMNRILNQERIKGRALMDEMLTPMNVHRWRSLGGKDPTRMDLIKRIQELRKQMLVQQVTGLEKDRLLEETQELYLALKEFMKKLPSHKVKAELNEVKADLLENNKKMKALVAELNTKDAEEKANMIKMDEMKSHLANTKSELCNEKRKKQKLMEERQMLVQMQLQCFSAPSNMQRTLGAGFKVVSQI